MWKVCFQLFTNLKLLSTSWNSNDGIIKIVNIVDSTQVRRIKAHEGSVKSLSFDPQRKYLASAGSDGQLKIWNYSEDDKLEISMSVLPNQRSEYVNQKISEETFIFTLYRLKYFNRFSWSPNGNVLAVPTPAGILIIQRDSWEIVKKLTDHKQEAIAVTWSPNGLYLISSHIDNSIVVWDYENNLSIERKKHESIITGLSWNPKFNTVVLADEEGQYALWKNVIPRKMMDPVKETANKTENYTEKKKSIESMFEDDIIIDSLENEYIDSHAIENEDFVDEDELMEEEEANTEFAEQRTVKHSQRSNIEYNDPIDNAYTMSIQEPFQPSSSDLSASRRYLVWNSVGAIITKYDDDSSYIEVEFSDLSKYKNFTITKKLKITNGSLGPSGLALTSSLEDNSRSVLMYQSFDHFGVNADWMHHLPRNENIELVAVGDSFVAIVTSKRFLRIFSSGGVQLQILCIPGPPVSLVAQGNLLALFYHSGNPINNTQNISYQLFNVKQKICLSQGQVPLNENVYLEWVGFSQENILTIFDSEGILKQLTGHHSSKSDNTYINMSKWVGQWTPVLDTSNHKQTWQRFWPIAVTMEKLRYIPISESEYAPHVLPRPVPSSIPLEVPVINNDSSTAIFEENYIRFIISYNHLIQRLCEECKDIENNNEIKAAQANLDQLYLRMMKIACEENKVDRAMGIAKELHLKNSLNVAVKIAKSFKQTILHENILNLINSKEQEQNKETINGTLLDNTSFSKSETTSFSQLSEQSNEILEDKVKKRPNDSQYSSQTNELEEDIILPQSKRTKVSDNYDVEIKPKGSILKSNPFTKVNPSRMKETSNINIFDTLGSTNKMSRS